MTMVLALLVLLVVAAVAAIALIHYSMYHGAWQKCKQAGMDVSVWQVALMALRKVDYESVCACAAGLHQATTPVPIAELEGLHLCGGNVRRVTTASLVATQNQTAATFRSLAALELLGIDPVEYVRKYHGKELSVRVARPEAAEPAHH